jgi:hypothetical protein
VDCRVCREGTVATVEARRADVEGGIVRRRVKPTMRVKSVAKLLPETKQRLDPAAPRQERIGRKGECAATGSACGGWSCVG